MKKFNIKVDGVLHEVEVEEIGGNVASSFVSEPVKSAPSSTPAASQASNKVSVGNGTVIAPLQGTIQTIKVNVGDKVNAGDVVVVIEAMKMENDVPANSSGTVKAIHVSKGVKVSSGDALIDIE